MPASEHEVFELLSTGSDASTEVKFLAYAIFAYQKRGWIEHFKAGHQGAAPTQADIDSWISNLTDFNFRNMRNDAVNMFDQSARAYLAEDIEAAKQEALRSAIVGEVKAAGAWWKQLGMALLTAILAPLILGGMLAAGYFYSLLPSPGDIGRRIEPPAASQGAKP